MKELKIAENVMLRETGEGAIELVSLMDTAVDGFYSDENQTKQIQMFLNDFLSRKQK